MSTATMMPPFGIPKYKWLRMMEEGQIQVFAYYGPKTARLITSYLHRIRKKEPGCLGWTTRVGTFVVEGTNGAVEAVKIITVTRKGKEEPTDEHGNVNS